MFYSHYLEHALQTLETTEPDWFPSILLFCSPAGMVFFQHPACRGGPERAEALVAASGGGLGGRAAASGRAQALAAPSSTPPLGAGGAAAPFPSRPAAAAAAGLPAPRGRPESESGSRRRHRHRHHGRGRRAASSGAGAARPGGLGAIWGDLGAGALVAGVWELWGGRLHAGNMRGVWGQACWGLAAGVLGQPQPSWQRSWCSPGPASRLASAPLAAGECLLPSPESRCSSAMQHLMPPRSCLRCQLYRLVRCCHGEKRSSGPGARCVSTGGLQLASGPSSSAQLSRRLLCAAAWWRCEGEQMAGIPPKQTPCRYTLAQAYDSKQHPARGGDGASRGRPGFESLERRTGFESWGFGALEK